MQLQTRYVWAGWGALGSKLGWRCQTFKSNTLGKWRAGFHCTTTKIFRVLQKENLCSGLGFFSKWKEFKVQFRKVGVSALSPSVQHRAVIERKQSSSKWLDLSSVMGSAAWPLGRGFRWSHYSFISRRASWDGFQGAKECVLPVSFYTSLKHCNTFDLNCKVIVLFCNSFYLPLF